MRTFSLMARCLPTVCVFCAQPVNGGRLCIGCHHDLPKPGYVCPICGEPMPQSPQADLCCAVCQQHPPPWSKCRAALLYEWPVDSALKALKFSAQLAYAAAFAEIMLPVLQQEFGDVDALLPVPLHRWRQALRGFNQAEEISRPLARATGLPIESAVRRVRATPAQSGLGRAARRRNLHAAFAMAATQKCRYPLLIDDVMTTGETCRQLSRLLLANGARKVGVLTVARASKRRYPGGGAAKV